MHAVIFDIDGTLLQSVDADDALYRASVRRVLGPVRLRPGLQDYDCVTDSGILAQVLDDNGLAHDAAHFADVEASFFDALHQHIEKEGPFAEIPGAKAHLQDLLESDRHAVAIATGSWRKTATLKLESAGFDICAAPLATADDSHERTEIMRAALARIGAHCESITYYGDGPWDQAACAELGWHFIAVGPTLGGIASYNGTQGRLP